jgi:hypothetical protein
VLQTGIDYHFVFCINTSSDLHQVYLNGALQSPTATSAVANPLQMNKIRLGNSKAANNPFYGTIYYVKYYSDQKTQAEVTDLYNKSTYSEIDAGKCTCFLPLKTKFNDGTEKTENIGSGVDATVGNGSTASTMPSFTNLGASFDGGDYLITNILPSSTGTMMCIFNPNSISTQGLMGGSDGVNRGMLFFSSSGLLAHMGTVLSVGGGVVRANAWHTGAVTWDTAGSIRTYLDGVQVGSTTAYAGSVSPLPIDVGDVNGGVGIHGTYFTGKIRTALVSTTEFNPTQLRNMHRRMINSINI